MTSAYKAIAKGYYRRKDFYAAAQYVRKHLDIHPEDHDAWINYGKVLTNTGQFTCAEHAILEARRLDANPEYLLDLQVLYFLTNNTPKYEAVVAQIEELIPDNPKFIFNRAWDKIHFGDTYNGWADLEAGRKAGIFGHCHDDWPEQRLTDISQVKGNRVAIVGEGGLGDEIIGARYANTIRELGGTPILILQNPLHDILGHLGECRSHDDRGEFDYYTPALGATAIFKTIPNENFMFPKPQYVAKHRIESDKIKVGICWHGNTSYEWENIRGVAKEKLTALASDKIELYSLQQDDTDLDLKTWDDTMGIIAGLDMIVSTCTSIVHVAGAMGKRVLVLLSNSPYYTWVGKEKWYQDVTTMPKDSDNALIEEWICQ